MFLYCIQEPSALVEELLRKGAIAEGFSQMEAERCYASILDYTEELKKEENKDLKDKVETWICLP